jgi:outer membrane protein OmpA-like peptidoglycan-associated protein
VKLEIGGHTDSDGDAAKNVALSQSRADAVKKILVDQGIDAARLTTKGYGSTKPVDVNTTPEGKANNRRVEFTKAG